MVSDMSGVHIVSNMPVSDISIVSDMPVSDFPIVSDVGAASDRPGSQSISDTLIAEVQIAKSQPYFDSQKTSPIQYGRVSDSSEIDITCHENISNISHNNEVANISGPNLETFYLVH